MINLSIDLSGVVEAIIERLKELVSILSELFDTLAPHLLQSEQFARDHPDLYLRIVARLREQYGTPQTSGPLIKTLK